MAKYPNQRNKMFYDYKKNLFSIEEFQTPVREANFFGLMTFLTLLNCFFF